MPSAVNSYQRFLEAADVAGLHYRELESGKRAQVQTPGHSDQDRGTSITYNGKETIEQYCTMRSDHGYSDMEMNPLYLESNLQSHLFDILAEHIDQYDFNIHLIAEVMANAAIEALRNTDLNKFPYDPHYY